MAQVEHSLFDLVRVSDSELEELETLVVKNGSQSLGYRLAGFERIDLAPIVQFRTLTGETIVIDDQLEQMSVIGSDGVERPIIVEEDEDEEEEEEEESISPTSRHLLWRRRSSRRFGRMSSPRGASRGRISRHDRCPPGVAKSPRTQTCCPRRVPFAFTQYTSDVVLKYNGQIDLSSCYLTVRRTQPNSALISAAQLLANAVAATFETLGRSDVAASLKDDISLFKELAGSSIAVSDNVFVLEPNFSTSFKAGILLVRLSVRYNLESLSFQALFCERLQSYVTVFNAVLINSSLFCSVLLCQLLFGSALRQP